MRTVLLALLLLPAALLAAEPQLPRLKLTYDVTWKDIGLGQATIVLRPEGGKDCYRYESSSKPVGIVRMFVGSPHETSHFCVAKGKVVPKHFEFVHTKSEEQSYTLDFDLKARTVTDGKGKVRDIPAIAQDHFGLQQAVRLWVLANKDKPDSGTVDFASVEGDKINTYTFGITGRDEEVVTPAGTFRTLRVERVDNPHRKSIFWLAAERDWMPVKVEQSRKNARDLEMVLTSP
ncbi:MAG TPA: DUF3108 domain-containing protein [Candidatus Binatia bacterium]|nr:DUF3108 domain-containing protein [Candidatus Binatia bacterium]